MAGIDKIYLSDYTEYSYLYEFCLKHDSEFVKRHNYSLLSGLYVGLTESTFADGFEHPVSNFDTSADIFIIKHIEADDELKMPSVIKRLRQQYSRDYELIRCSKSLYDMYSIDFTVRRLRLIESSSGKVLRHIKREHWDKVCIYLTHCSECDLHKTFSRSLRCFYDTHKGCRYYRSEFDSEGVELQDNILYNICLKRVYRYITRTYLHRGTRIILCCYGKDNEAQYVFEVV